MMQMGPSGFLSTRVTTQLSISSKKPFFVENWTVYQNLEERFKGIKRDTKLFFKPKANFYFSAPFFCIFS